MGESDSDDDYYYVIQPTGHGRPEDVVVTIDEKVVHYTDFVEVETKSKVTQDVLAYDTRNVFDRVEIEGADIEPPYEVTD